MGTRGLRVYRVHGIYYRIYVHWDSHPSGLGKKIVQEIPAKRAGFKVWIAEKIKYFEREKELLYQPKGYPKQVGKSVDIENKWGEYDQEPTADEPQGDLYMEWVYIVDLDNKCFIVRSGSGWSREFKLNHLPYHFFEQPSDDYQLLLIMPISVKHLYTPVNVSYIELNLLSRFSKLAPRMSPVPVAKRSYFRSECLTSWKPLSQLLLGKLLDRYITPFKALVDPVPSAILGSTCLNTMTTVGTLFNQLAYGILNLCDIPGRIQFRGGMSNHMPIAQRPLGVYPCWNPPEKNMVWMGEILVILESRISVEECLKAAIANAVDLVSSSRVPASGSVRTAVIFSIQALVIVHINYYDDNSRDPDVTYSQILPVITPADCCWYRCFGGLRAELPAGLVALIDLFTTQSESYSLPANLPVEIITKIYKYCDLATSKSFAKSSRAFRAVANAHPQIDNWELCHSVNHGYDGFMASHGPGSAKSVVSLEQCEYRHPGFQVTLFRGAEKIDLDLPFVKIVEQQQQGRVCCAELPILCEAPVIMTRAIDLSPYEDEREIIPAPKPTAPTRTIRRLNFGGIVCRSRGYVP